ncbi:hypothetical protein Tco_0717675 [Tanacetum coccineum]
MASSLVKRIAYSLLRVRSVTSSSRLYNTKVFQFHQYDSQDECTLKSDNRYGSVVRDIVKVLVIHQLRIWLVWMMASGLPSRVELEFHVKNLYGAIKGSQIVKLEAEKEKLMETLPLLVNRLFCSPEFLWNLASLQRSVMSLGAYFLSVEICEEVPDVLELMLKLDKGVAMKVSKDGSTLFNRSWSYLLELIASKDEDMNGLLAIGAPPDVDASSSQLP